ncbi:MAG: hypothetical protein KDC16_11745 [Saprospiraceae bacterium]|nr:hypothetical protein [Saprospiraceae bacterium]MCB9327473.1 hypothetical protein [Lewinellaceae bacterium]
MALFDSLKESLNESWDHVESYLNSSKKYYKLKALAYSSMLMSFFVRLILISGLLCIAAFFGAVAGVFALGEWMGSYILGSLVVGLFFLLLAVIILFFRGYISNMILRKISKIFFEIEDHEE